MEELNSLTPFLHLAIADVQLASALARMSSRSNAAKVANRAEAIFHPNVLKKEGWFFAFFFWLIPLIFILFS